MSILLSAVPILLCGTGVFFLVRLRGFFVLHPVACARRLLSRRPTDGISPFRALTVALAGTLGVGNIVGVASALCLGGPGAVVWMLLSALLAMVLKYAEITLGMRHRRPAGEGGTPTGGAPCYIEDGLTARGHPHLGRFLAAAFALLCLGNAVTMGSILQINAVAGALETAFSVPPLAVGLLTAILCLVVARGGARGLSRLTEAIVPLMTAGFLLACLAILILRRDRIPDAVSAILRDALRPAGAGAGVLGFLLSRGIRYGVMRGLVSNEAGCGTAPMAHAAADAETPAHQGLFGLVEVFVDTVLLCTVTALAILVSGVELSATADPVVVAEGAFSSVLGPWAGGFFAISILFFGVATILCWTHYGRTAVACLLPRRGRTAADAVFLGLFATSLIGGAVAAPAAVWSIADAAIALMTLLNLPLLLLLSREVAEETARLFSHPRVPRRIQWEGNAAPSHPEAAPERSTRP